MNIKEKDYILEYYGEFYNEECGKWNTSLKSKWYDYKINEYFGEHFKLKEVRIFAILVLDQDTGIDIYHII